MTFFQHVLWNSFDAVARLVSVKGCEGTFRRKHDLYHAFSYHFVPFALVVWPQRISKLPKGLLGLASQFISFYYGSKESKLGPPKYVTIFLHAGRRHGCSGPFWRIWSKALTRTGAFRGPCLGTSLVSVGPKLAVPNSWAGALLQVPGAKGCPLCAGPAGNCAHFLRGSCHSRLMEACSMSCVYSAWLSIYVLLHLCLPTT